MTNIYIKLDDNLHSQTLDMPIFTEWAPLLVDLFLYTYKYDFFDSLSTLPIELVSLGGHHLVNGC